MWSVDVKGEDALTDRDRQAVIAVTQAYREAWLANDSARVMETLGADAVLVPGGMALIAGERAIHDFWFPASGPSTMVTAMEQNVTDVVGGGPRRGLRPRRPHVSPRPSRREPDAILMVCQRLGPRGRWTMAHRAPDVD